MAVGLAFRSVGGQSDAFGLLGCKSDAFGLCSLCFWYTLPLRGFCFDSLSFTFCLLCFLALALCLLALTLNFLSCSALPFSIFFGQANFCILTPALLFLLALTLGLLCQPDLLGLHQTNFGDPGLSVGRSRLFCV